MIRRPGIAARLVPAFLALLCDGASIQALETDASQPLRIEADAVEIREAESISIYVGNVRAEQGSMRLHADHVTVYHHPDRRPRLIIALGQPADYRQTLDDGEGALEAFARRMEFDVERDEILMVGAARLIQGADQVTGERIVYDRGRAQFRAGGTGRVNITITPDAP